MCRRANDERIDGCADHARNETETQEERYVLRRQNIGNGDGRSICSNGKSVEL